MSSSRAVLLTLVVFAAIRSGDYYMFDEFDDTEVEDKENREDNDDDSDNQPNDRNITLGKVGCTVASHARMRFGLHAVSPGTRLMHA